MTDRTTSVQRTRAVLDAARQGRVGRSVNCGYYGGHPKTIRALLRRGLLERRNPTAGEVHYILTREGMQELRRTE